jgi:hypothetical protein
MRFYLAGPAHGLDRLTEGLVALGVEREVIDYEALD